MIVAIQYRIKLRKVHKKILYNFIFNVKAN